MKKFFSEVLLTENGDDVFVLLVDLINSKYVGDKSQILRDIALRQDLLYESDADKKFISYGEVRVHTVRTSGIKEFCLSCVQMGDGHIEILVLWNEFSERILSKLSELTNFLKSSVSRSFSSEHIIYGLKKL